MQVTEEKTERNRQVTKKRRAHREIMKNVSRMERHRRQRLLLRETLLRNRMRAQAAVRQEAERETTVHRTGQAHQETAVQEREAREETTPVSRTALREMAREETAARQEAEKMQDAAQDLAITEKTGRTEEDFLREDHRAAREEVKEETEAAVTTVSEAVRTGQADARVEERAVVPEIWHLHRSLPRLPKTARESATEKIRTRRKISRRIRAAEEDRTREADARIRDFRKHFRNRLHSQNRKRKNRRLRKSRFRRK